MPGKSVEINAGGNNMLGKYTVKSPYQYGIGATSPDAEAEKKKKNTKMLLGILAAAAIVTIPGSKAKSVSTNPMGSLNAGWWLLSWVGAILLFPIGIVLPGIAWGVSHVDDKKKAAAKKQKTKEEK
jgi:hypothetical protein